MHQTNIILTLQKRFVLKGLCGRRCITLLTGCQQYLDYTHSESVGSLRVRSGDSKHQMT
jgi:hypothetical protein